MELLRARWVVDTCEVLHWIFNCYTLFGCRRCVRYNKQHVRLSKRMRRKGRKVLREEKRNWRRRGKERGRGGGRAQLRFDFQSRCSCLLLLVPPLVVRPATKWLPRIWGSEWKKVGCTQISRKSLFPHYLTNFLPLERAHFAETVAFLLSFLPPFSPSFPPSLARS